MDMISSPKLEPEKLEGDTPTMRLFALLEVIAEKDQLLSLQVQQLLPLGFAQQIDLLD